MQQPARQCIVVLGMHRSGTSAATGVLSLLGGDIGATVMEKNPMNPKGFYENQRFRELNDEILSALGAEWDDPLPFREGWETTDGLDSLREDIRQALAEEFGPGPLKIIKDPRLCLLMPFWQPLLKEFSLNPAYLIIVRHPLESSASLAAGYGFSPQKGVLLWMRHMLAAEVSTRGCTRLFVNFEDLLHRPEVFQERIASVLSIHFPRPWDQACKDIQAFLEPSLKHHHHKDLPSCPGEAAALSYHAILRRLAALSPAREATEDWVTVDDIRQRFFDDLRFFYHPELVETAAKGRRASRTENVLRCPEKLMVGVEQANFGLIDESEVQQQLISRWETAAQKMLLSLERARNKAALSERQLALIRGSRAWRLAEFWRKWFYVKLLGR